VINTPAVLFDIRKSHAEVEDKNLFSFSYKNHHKNKTIHIKDLLSNFVQFLVQNLGMT
jgi:hypothetical protein